MASHNDFASRFGVVPNWQHFNNHPNGLMQQSYGPPPPYMHIPATPIQHHISLNHPPNMASPSSMSSVGSPQANSQGNAQASGGRHHQRTYQACIPCRKRKVKCDLGPVDNPHEPPCKRCLREKKPCVFSLQRRKKREGEDEDEEDSGYEILQDGGRRRLGAGPGLDLPSGPMLGAPLLNAGSQFTSIGPDGQLSARPLTPGRPSTNDNKNIHNQPDTPTHSSRKRPRLARHSTSADAEPDGNHTMGRQHATASSPLANRSAMLIQTTPVYSSNTALELLYHVAHEQQFPQGNGMQNGARQMTDVVYQPQQAGNANLIPAQIPDAVLRVWSRLRFVRSGWFRIQEGIAYVDYFYKNLYPLTPLAIPNYEHLQAMTELLEEEPMLALTILTIASRFMPLEGPGAAMRATYIHQQLNDSMHKQISRTIWGQKQFGGGICRAGSRQPDRVNNLWQTLGVIESLMLLTEWHTRAMHFPPDDDDGELLIPAEAGPITDLMISMPVRLGGPDGRRVDSWLEPCWRSDRICWILLNIADALAVEIGVYDKTTQVEFRTQYPNLSNDKVLSYFARKTYLKELIPLYKAQTSGRLELTGNQPISKSLLHDLQSMPNEQRLIQRIRRLGLESQLGTLPPTASYQDLLAVLTHKPQDLVIHFWSEATLIIDSGNQNLYRSRALTNELVDSGQYTDKILEYKPWLQAWLENFKACDAIPEAMRYILRIEYEYSRAFLCALALQAVVQRCVRNTPLHRMADLAANGQDAEREDRQEATPFTSADYRKWVGSDNPRIQECIDACRTIFRIIIEAPGAYLKHCPVRTYFRILSASLLLMKSFIIGATENDMVTTLTLLDQAMTKLRENAVDDVHVGNRFADMCKTLTEAARSRFVRLNRAEGNGSATSRAETPGLTVNNAGHLTTGTLNNGNFQPQFVPQQNGTSIPISSSGRATPPNPALWGITNQVFPPPMGRDASSFMPPPQTYYMTDNFDATGPNNMDGTGMTDQYQLQDWITLPYGDLITAGGDFTIGPNGPSIGGDDILDRMLWSAGVGSN